mmetsp:Transcript_9515/g.27657  ORF Transcript_9515/g.27657 Transcript_9515/m.27657 type:complete len:249 (-) Transcript_9515:146-892(-)
MAERGAQEAGHSASSRPRSVCPMSAERRALSSSPEIAVRLLTSSSAASRAASRDSASLIGVLPPRVAGGATDDRTASEPTSRAKKTPANGALNPAATPAAAPAVSSCLCLWSVMWCARATRRETPIPISTAGPSGPSELPVQSVPTAAAARPTAAAGRKGTPRSTSATCSARPGPSRPRGKSARIAVTSNPPSTGMVHVRRVRRCPSPPSPCVASRPYSAVAPAMMDILKSAITPPVKVPTPRAHMRN